MGHSTILSFGGAYSNHLHALSYACNQMNFKSIGVVRGDTHKNLNATLSFCLNHNMTLHYIDRYSYKNHKNSDNLLTKLKNKFGKFYIIPEGGSNSLGVKGCQEILTEIDLDFDYLCCAIGTGCTAAGLIKSMKKRRKLLGFSPFKKNYEQKNNILNFCDPKLYNNWEVISDNHFGGFSKINSDLIKFIHQFNLDYDIQLDLIDMGKLFYSLFDLLKKDVFPKKTRILVLHSGGLQGVTGFSINY